MNGGRFNGRCAVSFLPDGRRVQLLEAFGYVDPAGLEWFVPAEAIVDGASIPRALWSLTGGPFEGRYRDASVVHDWYCDRRNRPWRAVHRVFFHAMITSGVSDLRAKVMYAAVFAAGPRWSDTVVQNNRLDVPRKRGADVGAGAVSPKFEPSRELDERALRSLEVSIQGQDLSLDEIDAFVEADLLRP